MNLLLARIDEDAVAVYVALIVRGLVGLAAIVERDGVLPNVLSALADLLAVVLPVVAVPVVIDLYVVFEAGPDGCARVGRGRVNDYRAALRSSAVVYPVAAAARVLFA